MDSAFYGPGPRAARGPLRREKRDAGPPGRDQGPPGDGGGGGTLPGQNLPGVQKVGVAL